MVIFEDTDSSRQRMPEVTKHTAWIATTQYWSKQFINRLKLGKISSELHCMYFESLYFYVLGLLVNQEKYKCENHKLLKNMITNKNWIHLFSETSFFKTCLQKKWLLLRKHHEKHSVCSTVSWYIPLSLLIYSNLIVTYNDCLQLCCEFST